MEGIDGATPLNTYLRRSESDFREVVGLLTQCFMALAYIHKKSLIHWDLKSDNLLINRSGTVKLMDIGNARRLDDPGRGDKAYSTRGNVPEEALGDAGPGGQAGDSSRGLQVTLPSLGGDLR